MALEEMNWKINNGFGKSTKQSEGDVSQMEHQLINRGGTLVYKWLAWIFIVCILIQVFLAGLALFMDPSHWARHTGFSRFLMIPPILMLITSFIARLPIFLRLHSAGLIGMIILIFASALLSSEIGFISALHPVIAMILFWETMTIARKTHTLIENKEIQQ
jgi:hypothetical protein